MIIMKKYWAFIKKFMPSASKKKLRKSSPKNLGGYLWNACECNFVKNIKGNDAMIAFEKADKTNAIVVNVTENEIYLLPLSEVWDNTQKINESNLHEIYITNKDFQWCYFVISICGNRMQYFIERKNTIDDRMITPLEYFAKEELTSFENTMIYKRICDLAAKIDYSVNSFIKKEDRCFYLGLSIMDKVGEVARLDGEFESQIMTEIIRVDNNRRVIFLPWHSDEDFVWDFYCLVDELKEKYGCD